MLELKVFLRYLGKTRQVIIREKDRRCGLCVWPLRVLCVYCLTECSLCGRWVLLCGRCLCLCVSSVCYYVIDVKRCQVMLLSVDKCYWVLLSVDKCCWVLLSVARCYWERVAIRTKTQRLTNTAKRSVKHMQHTQNTLIIHAKGLYIRWCARKIKAHPLCADKLLTDCKILKGKGGNLKFCF